MADEKYYQLGTHTEEQWQELHAELIADGNTYEAVPSRVVEVDDDKQHSATRGSYLLTEEEATALKSDSRVRFINIDYSKYEEFKPPPDELQAVRPELVNRYSSGSVENHRNTSTVALGSLTPNRTGYQLYRHMQFLDPWVDGGLAENAIVNTTIQQYATGKNVDLIVADEGMWLGHPEFQSNCVEFFSQTTELEKPIGYTGGNLLPGNGTCDVLDLVLDAPYYIDPEWFDADPGNRLTSRWDGTTVPQESVARDWWGNASQRSAKFANEGTVTVTSNYTRSNCNGDNTAKPPGTEGRHGTPCGALAFGRTQGWAYNANKWNIDLYGSLCIGIEQGFDLQKLSLVADEISNEYDGWNKTNGGESLYKDLRNTFACVTFSSNAATEAICEGIPVVNLDNSSFSWPVSYHTLDILKDNVIRCDFKRAQWLYNCAYTQWTMKEINSGIVHKRLLDGNRT